jgi:hypothetical protein
LDKYLRGLLLLMLGMLALNSPALKAADLAGVQAASAGGERIAAESDSVLRIRSEPAVEAQVPDVLRQVPRQLPAGSASAAAPLKAAPQALFTHTKWQGPAMPPVPPAEAVSSREPDLNWKGSFNAVRPSVAAESRGIQTGVIQTSAELPLDTVQPVMLPTPSPARPVDPSEIPAPIQPQPLVQPQPAAPGPATIVQPNDSGGIELPTLERQLQGQARLTAEKCLTPHDLKSIRAITADIGVKPEDLTGGKRLPPECPLGDAAFQPRRWQKVTFTWAAAATSHKPIYFEDEQMERYGNCFGPVAQTTVSAVRFFATAPLVPYFMGVNPPNEEIYDLGQYRPGSCAPFYLDPLPLSVRGALYEGMFLGFLPAM